MQVYIRVRPDLPAIDGPCEGAPHLLLDEAANTIQVPDVDGPAKAYKCHRVFGTESTTEEVYADVFREPMDQMARGFNVTLFAYGQTGSGKTHTMFGPDNVISDFEASDVEEHGIVPRACALLFGSLAAAESGVLVQASYLEVYNDKLNDLLSGERGLLMREGGAKGVTVDGLSSEMVSSADEVMDLLARGNQRRVVAKMSMNLRSSRGHATLTLCLARP